jgi:divinyl protochlorophyllide a 8-vinyl-reductase
MLSAAGLGRYGYGEEPPAAMVPEEDVSALYRTLRLALDAPRARGIACSAGTKTAHYVLANRIPRPAQLLLRCLPAKVAAPLLLTSIARHTWTFAGSATVNFQTRPPRITIAGCPICRASCGEPALCEYYAASFETLFRTLVSRRAIVRESACEASGAPACVFEIRW